MLDVAFPAIRQLIADRRPGHMLDAPFYTDPAVFRADLDLIFGRHWIFVGVEPDIAEPGDVMTLKIGDNSILICRDDDGAIHALHNVCRHRAARLVSEEKTSVGRLVCPYHSWTYGLDGQLLHAEHMNADFDPACHGLRKVHLRSLAGLLFVCLADDPPADFDEMARIAAPYIAPHDIANCKVAHQIDLIEEGNWKLTMENNRECYHCALNHPELTASIFEYGFGFDANEDEPGRVAQREHYDTMVAELGAKWNGCGFPSEETGNLQNMISGYRIGRLPMDKDGESQTLDTKVACARLLGNIMEKRLGDLSFHTQPNSWHHLMSDHIVSFAVLPLEPGRTLLRTKWLVHKDAVEGKDYDLENLIQVWRETNLQDGKLVGLAHAGASSAGYIPGPYSPQTEGQVEDFVAWYIKRLAAFFGP
ncbi:aromatic ring-hydroxylating dioxygenase subunit alpha [Acidiphilium sp. AL]|uniref:Aromatic ring-hydroxylating dioxygenase subunit alpha n=1 Tax=Acidiphilium iwatense TaxID=768198 RepID=A0ABS9DY86_9PROT|nr:MULTISPECIES: aromatic ring-hydroxylating dioxygenase subunit alpha [Acidiphilium]MCF3947700.1 aromatic ring-hydroxylating dioxygenase subunit alpha [Acidiphilium iwatense]MCU4161078.1 aromatic ring-hydroxylating dioxygenase subunit alpha [Acidiphilium sp. AL]